MSSICHILIDEIEKVEKAEIEKLREAEKKEEKSSKNETIVVIETSSSPGELSFNKLKPW